MTSMKIRSASIALVALAAMGCRETGTEMDVNTGTDAARNDVQGGMDVQPGVDVPGVDAQPGVDVQPPRDGGGTTGVTIRQIQDLADPMHPASGSHVTLNEPGLVTLSQRILLSSATGGSSATCRFGVWVGSGSTGDFTGIQVQELIPLGSAASCFDVPEGKIPAMIRAGTPISVLSDLTYTEFCSGPMGVDRTMCRNWEQTQLTVRSTTTLTAGAVGNAPSPTTATVPELGTMNATLPGSRAINLEAGLVSVSGVVRVVMNDTGFSDYFLDESAGSANSVQIEESNSVNASCLRTYLAAHNGATITLTGLLEPNFGLWSVRVRTSDDVTGTSCGSMDGGVSTDAGGGG